MKVKGAPVGIGLARAVDWMEQEELDWERLSISVGVRRLDVRPRIQTI